MQAVVNAMASSIEQGISEKEAAELDLRFHDTYQSTRHKRLISTDHTTTADLFMLSRNVAADFRAVAADIRRFRCDPSRDKQRALPDRPSHAAYEIVSESHSCRHESGVDVDSTV
jgi:hypothetical protein